MYGSLVIAFCLYLELFFWTVDLLLLCFVFFVEDRNGGIRELRPEIDSRRQRSWTHFQHSWNYWRVSSGTTEHNISAWGEARPVSPRESLDIREFITALFLWRKIKTGKSFLVSVVISYLFFFHLSNFTTLFCTQITKTTPCRKKNGSIHLEECSIVLKAADDVHFVRWVFRCSLQMLARANFAIVLVSSEIGYKGKRNNDVIAGLLRSIGSVS